MHQKFALVCYLAERPGWHSREKLLEATKIKEGSLSTFLKDLAQGKLAESGKSASGKTVWRALVRPRTAAELEADGPAESAP